MSFPLHPGHLEQIRQRPAPSVASDADWRSTLWQGAGLILAALVLRSPSLGDPAVGMDEQFYLLVADRMWKGDLPFVDVWDRKPIGLFLLYALFRPFGATGVLAYQLAAVLFAAGTAAVIGRIVGRFASSRAAFLSGLLYLLYLPALGGGGGQAPVFYNLFIAGAALLTLRAGAAERPRPLGLAAMCLTGLALQIKYSVVLEGLWFGLYLLGRQWRVTRNGRAVARYAVELGFCALGPTLLVAAVYVLLGRFDAFFYANFRSFFAASPPAGFSEAFFLINTLMLSTPLLLFAAWSVAHARGLLGSDPIRFVLIWSIAAIVGASLLGHYYAHYVLPILAPLSVLIGLLLSEWKRTVPVFLGVALVAAPAVARSYENRKMHQDAVRELVASLQPYTDHGCIYLNDGPTIVYLLTGSCLPTPYVFPEHLNNAAEQRATGATAAMAALIAKRPSAIVLADAPLHHPRNLETAQLIEAEVAGNYRLKTAVRDVFPHRRQRIFIRNDLH